MADHEEEDLRTALRMSMQNSPPEPKRSKPRDGPAGAPTGLPEESSEVKTRRLQRELMATAAEKRMLDARKASPSPSSVSGSAGSSGSALAAKVVRKDKELSLEEVNLGKGLSEEDAKQLFSMVFGAEVTKGILAQWSNQGIRFSPDPETSMGLVQHEGGPCGVLAAIQAFVLKYLIFCPPELGKVVPNMHHNMGSRTLSNSPCVASNNFASLTEDAKARALIRSMGEILFLCGSNKRAVIATLSVIGDDTERSKDNLDDEVITKSLEGLSIESAADLHKVLRVNTYTTRESAFKRLQAVIPVFQSRMGALLFLISALLSRGLDLVQADRDDPSLPLVTAPFGHASQEIVNLLLCGQAVPNVFDGKMDLGAGMSLKGVSRPVEVGFLTLLESLNFCKVGQYLKCPKWPLAIDLLNEVRRSGLRPDIITYNTLISGCSRESNLEEAVKVYNDMEAHNCQPDLWTYNAMISVYGRCGESSEAERLFKELESKGFFPDAVTYNSLLYAFARELDIEKVRDIGEDMMKMGFGKDEMTYNTIIHMYGKQGQHDLAFQLYRDMKMLGRTPDAVTYTVLIDSLGKANKITEAANVMSEMLDSGVKPTLRTYSALMCAYAKAGKQVEAQETFDCMVKSGIRPDHLAYSVILDIFLKVNETKKAITLYQEMLHDGFKLDHALYGFMLRVLGRENKLEVIERVIRDMEKVGGMNPQVISSILVKGECYDHAAKMLRLAITSGYELDRESLLSIVSSYSSCGRHSEACELLEFLREHAPGSNQLITEALVVIQCKAHRFDAALVEYSNTRGFHSFSRSSTMYEILIQGCEENELFGEASQVYSDMRLYGVEPSEHLYQIMVLIYCKMGFPETAHLLIDQAEMKGIFFDNVNIYVNVIEVYGKLKLWQKAESLVGSLRQRCKAVDRKVWNALIQAYAASGCYERARVIFNTMMRDGPSPTIDSVNGLLQALIADGRLDELYVLIQELQDMGLKISKSSILLMLEAFAREGNIFEVKKIYHGMKAAGYFPNMDCFRIMIKLLCRGKRVRDVEAMVYEMEEAGFKPDLSIWNSMLKLYAGIKDFKKTVKVYQQIQEAVLQPDDDTYNTLIIMYCRDCRPEEGLSLMQEMRRQGLEPKLDTYKSLISAFGKQKLLDQAEELFEELRSNGCKLDRSFYHTMMKMFRNSGNHAKAEMLFTMMKEAGIEPNFATMHLLMVSYGSSGQPQEAEKVLDNLKVTGLDLDTLPYSSVIGAYLKNGDYNIGIQKLNEMKEVGLEPDHRIWTCFIRAASLSQHKSEAIILLNALRDAGFDLPIRLVTEKPESLILEVDHCLEKLEPLEDNAAFNFVNALEDLLWAYELRATASWVFQLAVKRGIYNNDVFRVADKDWAADFRKLSAGSALVGLTLWLDQMQDASLEGYPESPKSVVLITGTSEYNMVSLNSTLKACLWEMGSPFLPCKTRSGLLVAKAHSLRMWLKDSPFCLDLELKDAPALPESNSMQLIDGCFLRRGLVPAFKEITERLGLVRPKKFARLALLSDEKREKVIQSDIEGRKEKLEKMKENDNPRRVSRIKKLRKRKYVRPSTLSNTKQIVSGQKALK